MAPSLIELPQEVLGNILSFLLPSDIVSFGRSCRRAINFIGSSNQLLWRDAFLHIYDHPEDAWATYTQSYETGRSSWDWHRELMSRSLAIKALRQRWPQQADKDNYEQHVDTILSIIDTAKSQPSSAELARGRLPQADDRSSRNLQLLASILLEDETGLERLMFDDATSSARTMSDDFGRPRTRAMTSATKDRNRSDGARRLHTLYGLSRRDKADRKHFHRRYVYDWQLSNAATDYGPYSRDGSGQINWTLLEAAMACISLNFGEAVDGQLTPPEGLFYSIPNRTLRSSTITDDWAGVTGIWLGTYAFLDYSSLLAFNAGLVDFGITRSFDLRDEPEVCGDLLLMELKLDDSVRANPVLKTNVPICNDLPPLYFKGSSRGSEYPSIPITTIKGFVALAVGGREVKWKIIVEYNGVDQWQLEGVQPGGVRSGGIFGVWSNVEHEPNSPVGPFCYFPQELCKTTSIVLAGGSSMNM
ncbi:uncharacterized protein HMPREF1541_08874 [Cyphellophora europaea CBS 101466]|uniref:F-box domain-containing protein n=1 Tax=Cyphellophora europaea (strain CBS 101466) TaxID=1220924 RepID=W2RJE5_CYPE1|nr:uncharacterized protein HMPREF1541_08874 [Cyphellophora europaea CBS 101466]ETN36596.1 hypothetical protein HMPREF1541_08874 [Cyphellophora europaea CBS 101466]